MFSFDTHMYLNLTGPCLRLQLRSRGKEEESSQADFHSDRYLRWVLATTAGQLGLDKNTLRGGAENR